MSHFSTELAEPIEVPTPIYEPTHEPLNDNDADMFGDDELQQPGNATNEPIDGTADHHFRAKQHSSVRSSKSGYTGRGKGGKGGDDGYSDYSDGFEQTPVGAVIATVCTVLHTIVFILTVIATPLDVFRAKDPQSWIPDTRQRACYSMWGYKRCGAHGKPKDYKSTDGFGVGLPESGWQCSKWESRLKAASAFSILSIVFTLISLVGVFFVFFQKMRSWLAAVCCLVSMVMLLVCWAILAGTYYTRCNISYVGQGLVIVGQDDKMKESYNLGASFALLVTAWGLELVTAVLLFFV